MQATEVFTCNGASAPAEKYARKGEYTGKLYVSVCFDRYYISF